MRLYTYVIQYDGGSAPNYEPPYTTLAVCKPDIRRCSRVGDAMLAFTGSRLSREPHAVCWAGVIREKLTFAEYWRDPRFENKKPGQSRTPDNFYMPVGDELQWVKNTTHDDPDAHGTDTGGVYVLAMEPTWQFGSGGPILPSHFALQMRGARRKHRVRELTDVEWKRLRQWLDAQKQGRTAHGRGSCRGSGSSEEVASLLTRRRGCR